MKPILMVGGAAVAALLGLVLGRRNDGSTPARPIDVNLPPTGGVPVTPPPDSGRRPDRRPSPPGTPGGTRPRPVDPVPDVTLPAPVVPSPEPPLADAGDRRIPANVDSQTAEVAKMLYRVSPGPLRDADDMALNGAYKRATGVTGDKRFYGRGTALALIARGVVPPAPWDWVSPKSEDIASLRRNVLEAKRNDPARADLWDELLLDLERA